MIFRIKKSNIRLYYSEFSAAEFKFYNFSEMNGEKLNHHLKILFLETKIKFCKTMALLIIIYLCENSVSIEDLRKRLQTAEMNYLRTVAGFRTSDKIRDDTEAEVDIKYINDMMEKQSVKRRAYVKHMRRLPP
jgi:hypothetical protein